MPRPAAMTRRHRAMRAPRRHPLDKLITGFVGGGVLLVMLPKALSHLPGQAVAMAGLQRYGWILLLLGLGLLAFRFLSRAAKPVAAAESNVVPFPTAPPARPTRPPKATLAELAPAKAAPAVATSSPDIPPARPTAWGPEVFRLIEWRRVEAVVETLFAQAGFISKSACWPLVSGIKRSLGNRKWRYSMRSSEVRQSGAWTISDSRRRAPCRNV